MMTQGWLNVPYTQAHTHTWYVAHIPHRRSYIDVSTTLWPCAVHVAGQEALMMKALYMFVRVFVPVALKGLQRQLLSFMHHSIHHLHVYRYCITICVCSCAWICRWPVNKSAILVYPGLVLIAVKRNDQVDHYDRCSKYPSTEQACAETHKGSFI